MVIRFMRTPSFLVRFVDLSPNVGRRPARRPRSPTVGQNLADRSSLRRALGQKVDVEREELLAALDGIQTGGIAKQRRRLRPSERRGTAKYCFPTFGWPTGVCARIRGGG